MTPFVARISVKVWLAGEGLGPSGSHPSRGNIIQVHAAGKDAELDTSDPQAWVCG